MKKHYYTVKSRKIIEVVGYVCWNCNHVNQYAKKRHPDTTLCVRCGAPNNLAIETNSISELGKEAKLKDR